MRELSVYTNEIKAGILSEAHPGHDYTFIYDADYLASDQPPVSVTLPKRKEAYRSEHLFPFFTNMLPEGANRKVICRTLKIDEEDFFGLLSAMANQDFIGAVQLKK